MHRSGTSALAGALAALGLTEPSDLMAAQPDNPKGFHELSGIADLNDRILADLGMSWDRAAAPGHDQAALIAGRYAAEASTALDRSFGRAEAIILKDPRIALLWPLWDDALRQQGFAPLYVLSHRNPLDVAASLKTRNGLSQEHAFHLWLTYVLSALEVERQDGLRAVVDYDLLLTAPAAILAVVATGLDLPRKSPAIAVAVASLDTADRHQYTGVQAFEAAEEVPGLLKDCWSLLRRWRSLSREERLAALAAARATFDDEGSSPLAPFRDGLWWRNPAGNDDFRTPRDAGSDSLQRPPTATSMDLRPQGIARMLNSWDGVWVRRARTMGEHGRQQEADKAIIEARVKLAQRLLEAPDPVRVPGICVACGEARQFTIRTRRRENAPPQANWRETVSCTCGLNARARSALHALIVEGGLREDGALYATEQITALYRKLTDLFPNVVGSEFLADGTPPGSQNARGIRFEDLTQLTFPTATLDAVMSLDVLEHVPDYRAALQQIRRCLKPGGTAIMTFPFRIDLEETLVRARVSPDGEIEHLLPAEYHGDPIRADGALCYYHFGWSLLNDMREVGFSDAYLLSLQSTDFGYLGSRQALIVGRA